MIQSDTAQLSSTDLPDVPDEWEHVDRDDLHYAEYDAWAHRVTGLRVAVAADRKPTQMHNPRTSRDDTGYVARVADENYQGQLTYGLSSREASYHAAERFMRRYSEGEFQVPAPGSGPGCAADPIKWEGK